MPHKQVSEAVKALKVDKAAFDAVLKALIASPPLSKAEISARIHGWRPGPLRKPAKRKASE